jgi:hypothetical protein
MIFHQIYRFSHREILICIHLIFNLTLLLFYFIDCSLLFILIFKVIFLNFSFFLALGFMVKIFYFIILSLIFYAINH